ncbi:hypothetical protein BWI93_04060 [Siphonobacter sp. BAB-5385]|uniref:hypothetical protein n=1 Tax=Siphonobacter sp. BAB-5385 TaxID=1864822 RepID=UPI000B9E3348|nr:hypothetical protein [Siphonobacter sp. BAB-5385]OZI09343.1 hypothetical protein BWI93_04060 [Siphonobacter sp. BAB-5385]
MVQVLGFVLLAVASIVTYRVLRALLKFDPKMPKLHRLGWAIFIVLTFVTGVSGVFLLSGWNVMKDQPVEFVYMATNAFVAVIGLAFNQFLKDYSEKKGDEKLGVNQTHPCD